MWLRNLLFAAVCLAGIALVANSLLRRDRLSAKPPETSKHAAAESREHDATAIQNSVERLNDEFRKHWQVQGLAPAPLASDLLVARRLALALVGTLPSLEELRALEGQPPGERQSWFTEHLLADRRFADYWAERLARVYVGNEQGNVVLFRRRRFVLWLADRIAEGMPYDELARHLLADEGIWTGNPAANFVTATAVPGSENQPDPVRLAGRTARAFLGLRIDCLQCHEDKLGNVELGSEQAPRSGTQADFHQLAAFFGSTRITLTGVSEGDNSYKTKYLGADHEVVVRPEVPFARDHFDGHGSRRSQLARWVTHENNRPFARATVNRVWALLFGRPLVEPIDDIPLAGPFPSGLEALADDFVEHGYDLQRLIRVIAASEVFRRDSQAHLDITQQHEAAWAVFPLSRLRPEQTAAAVIQASSLKTIDGEAHVLMRIAMSGQTGQFVRRYGDLGEDEFADQGSTIPQRLLMMNGNLVKERTRPNPLVSASTRIASLTSDPEKQVEAAYLAVLTRRPTHSELEHFASRLAQQDRRSRVDALEDLFWTLVNSSEFSWNH
jgi:hypothetical protein